MKLRAKEMTVVINNSFGGGVFQKIRQSGETVHPRTDTIRVGEDELSARWEMAAVRDPGTQAHRNEVCVAVWPEEALCSS